MTFSRQGRPSQAMQAEQKPSKRPPIFAAAGELSRTAPPRPTKLPCPGRPAGRRIVGERAGYGYQHGVKNRKNFLDALTSAK